MDKHICIKCGKEVDSRDMCGFSSETLCLKCGYKPTESESLKVVWWLFLLISIIVIGYGLAINFGV